MSLAWFESFSELLPILTKVPSSSFWILKASCLRFLPLVLGFSESESDILSESLLESTEHLKVFSLSLSPPELLLPLPLLELPLPLDELEELDPLLLPLLLDDYPDFFDFWLFYELDIDCSPIPLPFFKLSLAILSDINWAKLTFLILVSSPSFS